MTSEFVYIKIRQRDQAAAYPTETIRASVEAKGSRFDLSSDFKDKFRMIVSVIVSNFEKKIWQ